MDAAKQPPVPHPPNGNLPGKRRSATPRTCAPEANDPEVFARHTRSKASLRRSNDAASGHLVLVRLTAQTLSCAARAHGPKPERRAACLHVRRAMQAA